MDRPIGPAVGEFQQDLPAVGQAEAIRRDGRTEGIAAEAFKSAALACRNPDGGLEV